MKCNKCGTPIIPGEDTCRICGTKSDFSKREPEPEIIDFPDEEETKENINIDNELPDLESIVNSVEETDTTIKKVEPEPTVNVEIKEEVKNEIKPEEIQNNVEPEINPEEVVEEVKEDVMIEPEAVELNLEAQEKVQSEEVIQPVVQETKVKPKVKANKGSANIGLILITVLLLVSIGLNIYLFVKNGNREAISNNPSQEEVYSKVIYNDYNMTLPSKWITDNKVNQLLIYDETETWTASMQVIDEVTYDSFVNNKDNLITSLSELKYQFTSNYTKQVNNQEFYLFKGKYYNYSVYIIATKLNDNTMLISDLKFKGEVDDILLNNILVAMTTVVDSNNENLFTENFEFNDLTDNIKEISQNKE